MARWPRWMCRTPVPRYRYARRRRDGSGRAAIACDVAPAGLSNRRRSAVLRAGSRALRGSVGCTLPECIAVFAQHISAFCGVLCLAPDCASMPFDSAGPCLFWSGMTPHRAVARSCATHGDTDVRSASVERVGEADAVGEEETMCRRARIERWYGQQRESYRWPDSRHGDRGSAVRDFRGYSCMNTPRGRHGFQGGN